MLDTNSPFQALQAFLDNNPDLPTGEDTPQAHDTVTATKSQPRLDIVLERKGRAGKSATIITGFTISDDEIATLASKLKSRLGTGGSARGGEILIQGDRRQDVLQFLKSQGYKARVI